jgi:hypothetical protein
VGSNQPKGRRPESVHDRFATRIEETLMAYEPKLPEGITLPPGATIDTSSARYREFEAMATRHGLSQAAFSETLGLEAKRVAAAHASAPAPAPAPAPAVPADFDKLSSSQQFAYALSTGKRTR